MVTRRQVIDKAREWVGVRWHHLGRARAGVDCAGLLIVTARELGLGYLDDPVYGTVPDGNRLREKMDECLDRVRYKDRRPGDIALMKWKESPTHLGILTDGFDPLGMIHAYAVMRKVVETRLDEDWMKKIVSFYSFRGLED